MEKKAVNRIGKALLLATAGMLLATGAWAQQAVARLKQVTGNVLVSREAGMATGAEAQPILNGTRIITTANSEVVVAFDNGCEIRVRENQSFEVDSGKPCAALIPQSLAVAQPAIAAPLAGYVVPGLLGVGALAGGGGSPGGGNAPPPPPPISPN